MKATTLKLQQTDSEFIKSVGTCIEVNGKKFYNLPYWYEEVGDGLYVTHSFEKLPIELKIEIVKNLKFSFKKDFK